MDPGLKLVKLIDETYARTHEEDGMRRHLGASIIGRTCMREIWYSFRWVDSEPFDGRMLRLFDRGHREETVFASLLRSVGATVWTEEAKGKQFLISALGGHFGGSVDGVAVGIPGLPIPPGTPVLLEEKTHNDKRFAELKKKGLQVAQPKHYKQAQIYMHGLNLEWCLYCAVNKNDDELWFSFFPRDETGAFLLRRAETVIFGQGIPQKISPSPAWFECRFCAMHAVCHLGKTPRLNCRTCVHSVPEPDGSWSCRRGQPEINTSPKIGCQHHQYMPDLLPC